VSVYYKKILYNMVRKCDSIRLGYVANRHLIRVPEFLA